MDIGQSQVHILRIRPRQAQIRSALLKQDICRIFFSGKPKNAVCYTTLYTTSARPSSESSRFELTSLPSSSTIRSLRGPYPLKMTKLKKKLFPMKYQHEVDVVVEFLRLKEVRKFYLSVCGTRLKSRPGPPRPGPDQKLVTLLQD